MSVKAILFLFLLWPSLAIVSGGPCSNYQPQLSCSPGCGETCTYYLMSLKKITKTVKRVPFTLSVFKPDVPYCDLDGESQLSSVMNRFPYQLGSVGIERLPMNVSLSYNQILTRTRSGPSCDWCTKNAGLATAGSPSEIKLDDKKYDYRKYYYADGYSSINSVDSDRECSSCKEHFYRYTCTKWDYDPVNNGFNGLCKSKDSISHNSEDYHSGQPNQGMSCRLQSYVINGFIYTTNTVICASGGSTVFSFPRSALTDDFCSSQGKTPYKQTARESDFRPCSCP